MKYAELEDEEGNIDSGEDIEPNYSLSLQAFISLSSDNSLFQHDAMNAYMENARRQGLALSIEELKANWDEIKLNLECW